MATFPLPTFLPCLELGLQVNHHDLIPCFSCELAAMRHISLPKKREPGAITRPNMLWTQGSVQKLVITKSIRYQEHHQWLYFHVLFLKRRKEPKRNSPEYCFPAATWRQVCWWNWNQAWGATGKKLPLWCLQTAESYPEVNAMEFSLIFLFLEVS